MCWVALGTDVFAQNFRCISCGGMWSVRILEVCLLYEFLECLLCTTIWSVFGVGIFGVCMMSISENHVQ